MLADLAVTDAKIAAMAASKLSGQVPAANAASGGVIQVVQFETVPSNITSTSTTYINSGMLDVPITPKEAGSKILVTYKNYIRHVNAQADNWGGGTMIYRAVAGGSYNPVSSTGNPLDGHYINDQYASSWQDSCGETIFLDAPTYTLGQTINYQLWYRRSSRGAGGWYLHHVSGLGAYTGVTRVIGIAMEIRA